MKFMYNFSDEEQKQFKEFFEKRRIEIAEMNEPLDFKKMLGEYISNLEKEYHSYRIEYLNEQIKEKRFKLGFKGEGYYSNANKKAMEANKKALDKKL